jgi:phosphonate transport system substrate-binding protein
MFSALKEKSIMIFRVHIIILISFIMVACNPKKPAQLLDLTDLQPLPAIASGEVIPFKVAVASVISPQGTAESYRPMLNYLSQKLNRPVELVHRSTYAETNALLAAGLVDVAFVCTGAYIVGERTSDMELLVAPEVNGEPAYYSYLIVPIESSARSMEDLRGKVFAFTDPLSNTGRFYPLYLIQQLGTTPELLFSRTFYTYSHDEAIRAVANGLADGAAVDNLIYQYLIAREPDLEGKLRIIQKSPPFGIPPVVVNPNIRPQLRAELQELFLTMADDPDGRRVLDHLDIDRFVLLPDSAYDSVRLLEESLDINLIDTP